MIFSRINGSKVDRIEESETTKEGRLWLNTKGSSKRKRNGKAFLPEAPKRVTSELPGPNQRNFMTKRQLIEFLLELCLQLWGGVE